jgi:hypothetical protein
MISWESLLVARGQTKPTSAHAACRAQPQIEPLAGDRRCAAGGVRPLGKAGHAPPGGDPEVTAPRREDAKRRGQPRRRPIGQGFRSRALGGQKHAQATDPHPSFPGHISRHHRHPLALRGERASDNAAPIPRSAYFPHVRAARSAMPRGTVESLPRVSAPREHTFEGSRPSAARTDGSSPNSTDPSGFATQQGTGSNAAAVGTDPAVLAWGGVAIGTAIAQAGALSVGLSALAGAGNVVATLAMNPFGGSKGGSYQVPSGSAAATTNGGGANAPIAVAQNRPPGPAAAPYSQGLAQDPGVPRRIGEPSGVPCYPGLPCAGDGGPLDLKQWLLPSPGDMARVGGAIWNWFFPPLPAIKGGMDAFGMYRFTWQGGGYASFTLRGSKVVVDYIVRGGAPAGAAGAMLAKAIQAAGAAKPTELVASNVLQKASSSTAVLQATLTSAAKALGGTVQSIGSGVDAGKTWVRVTIGY